MHYVVVESKLPLDSLTEREHLPNSIQKESVITACLALDKVIRRYSKVVVPPRDPIEFHYLVYCHCGTERLFALNFPLLFFYFLFGTLKLVCLVWYCHWISKASDFPIVLGLDAPLDFRQFLRFGLAESLLGYPGRKTISIGVLEISFVHFDELLLIPWLPILGKIGGKTIIILVDFPDMVNTRQLALVDQTCFFSRTKQKIQVKRCRTQFTKVEDLDLTLDNRRGFRLTAARLRHSDPLLYLIIRLLISSLFNGSKIIH